MKTVPRPLALALLAVLAAACSKPALGPGATAVRWHQSLIDGRAHEAYELLTDSDRALKPEGEVASYAGIYAMTRSIGIENQASLVSEEASGDQARVVVRVTARVEGLDHPVPPHEEPMWLKREHGAWRVWANYEGQAYVQPLVDRASAELKAGRKGEARRLLEQALSACPQSRAARAALAKIS